MKGKQLKSLSGTVLIMVLTVMLVLIIMLMATLTVVTTASQRIYAKYEEQQAYYTARSALDVYTGNILSDGAYYAYDDSNSQRQYKYTDTSVSPAVEKNVPMKQGLALQLDLYKIKSQNADGIDLSYAENPVKGDGTFSGAEEDNFTLDSSTGLDYIEYDVSLPSLNSGSNQYGKMVDNDLSDEDGDGETSDQIARIRVEILDRKLNSSPSYTTDQLNRFLTGDTDQTGCPADATALQTAIANGSRSKDYMKIKVTSTVKMMGVEGVAIVIFETTEKDPPAGDNAITTTGGYTGGGGAQFGAAGGAATMDPGTSVIADGNTVSGKLFSVGSFEWKSASKTDFGEGDKVVAMGDIDFTNNPTIYAKAPGMFFYAGGTYFARGNVTDDSADVSIICNTLSSRGGDYTIKGNVFCDTVEASQNGKATGNIYANTISTPYVQEVRDGDGNLVSLNVGLFNQNINLWQGGKIQQVQINSEWVPKPGGQPWETVEKRTVTVLAEYNYADYADKIRVTDYSGNATGGVITASSSKVDTSTYTVVERDGKVYRKINLPGRLSSDCSDNYIEIPTAQAMFKDYCVDDAFDMTTGDLKIISEGETDPYSAANKSAALKTGTKMLAEFIDNPNIDAATATMDDIISSVNAETLGGSPGPGLSAEYEITLDGNTKYYKLDPGVNYENVTWTVKGSSGRLVLFIPDNASVELKKCKLVTDTVDPVNGDKNITNGTTKAPKVDIYGGDQSVLTISQKGYISGYIIMPTGQINADGGLAGTVNYDDGNGLTTAIGDTAIVGSILCGEFNESNKTGVIYLDKNSGGDTPGEPILSVQASQYVRS